MRRRVDRQRGAVMIVSMMVIMALLGLASLTVVNVRGSLAASGHERFRTLALYAAETGVSVSTDFLRRNIDGTIFWTAYVSPDNTAPTTPTGLAGSGVLPGQTGAVLNNDLNSWYEVVILNNASDAGFVAGEDRDARVLIRSTGHGPNGTTVVLEVEIRAEGASPGGRPCPAYAQEGLAEDGAGRNDCLSRVDATDTATFRPN